MILVPPKGDVIIHKRAMCSIDYLELKQVDDLTRDIDRYLFAIGHNRHATKGGIKNSMAHPFQIGDISLVHNGTLTTQGYLPNGLDFLSDSEAITNAIDVQGAEDTIKTLDGAFALVWHDAKDNTLHMVRNEERPLSFGFVKGQDTMLIASEVKMMEWLADRNELELESTWHLGKGHEAIFGDKDFRDYTFKTHTLKKKTIYPLNNVYKGTTGQGKNGNKLLNYAQKKALNSRVVVKLEDVGLSPEVEVDMEVEKFVPYNEHGLTTVTYGYLECNIPIVTEDHTAQIHGTTKQEWEWIVGGLITANVQSIFKDKQTGEYTIIAENPGVSSNNNWDEIDVDGNQQKEHTETVFYGPNKTEVDKKRWDELTKHGCVMCTGNILDDDNGSIMWTMNNEPVCQACVKSYKW